MRKEMLSIMIDMKEFTKLKEQASKLQRKKDRAAGQIEQLTQTMKKEFGCSTIEEAQTLLKELKLEKSKLEKKFAKELKIFKTEYKKFLRAVEQGPKETSNKLRSSSRTDKTRKAKLKRVKSRS